MYVKIQEMEKQKNGSYTTTGAVQVVEASQYGKRTLKDGSIRLDVVNTAERA